MGLNKQILIRGDDSVHFSWRCPSICPWSKDVWVELFLANPNLRGYWMPVNFLERTASGSMSLHLCDGETHRFDLETARAIWASLRNRGWKVEGEL